jgi:hypothetical protein
VRPFRWRAAALTLVSITACAVGIRADEHVYLVGGELHVGNGRVIENSVIEIAGDTFAAVSERSERRTPENVPVIDVSGHWITPGFIAGSSQMGLVEISLEGRTRDTTHVVEDLIRSGHDPAAAINADSSLIPIQAIEGITSAAVTPVGGLHRCRSRHRRSRCNRERARRLARHVAGTTSPRSDRCSLARGQQGPTRSPRAARSGRSPDGSRCIDSRIEWNDPAHRMG